MKLDPFTQVKSDGRLLGVQLPGFGEPGDDGPFGIPIDKPFRNGKGENGVCRRPLRRIAEVLGERGSEDPHDAASYRVRRWRGIGAWPHILYYHRRTLPGLSPYVRTVAERDKDACCHDDRSEGQLPHSLPPYCRFVHRKHPLIRLPPVRTTRSTLFTSPFLG